MIIKVLIYSTPTTGWKKIKYFFSYFQKVFSKNMRKMLSFPLEFEKIGTHVALDYAEVRDSHLIIQAGSYEVKISDYWTPLYSFEFNVPESLQEKVIDKLKTEFLGRGYGYLQLISFIKRWTLSWFKDSRNIGVPFVGGVICTELVYWFFYDICFEMGWYEDINFLQGWNSNLIYPIDILIFADYFHKKNKGMLTLS